MKARLEEMEHRKIENLGTKVKKLDDIKNDFGDQLETNLAKVENDGNNWKGYCKKSINENTAQINGMIQGATAKFTKARMRWRRTLKNSMRS